MNKKYVAILPFLALYAAPVYGMDCNPSDPTDLSRVCTVTLQCGPDDIRTSQGCTTPFGCSAPAIEACPVAETTATTHSDPIINSDEDTYASGFVNIPTGTPACDIQPGQQSCSVPVYNNAADNSLECYFDSSQSGSYFQQDVRGEGPVETNPNTPNFGQPQVTYFNSTFYATPSAAAELARCLGGSVVSTSVVAKGSPYYIPPTFEIVLPGGIRENAGYLINRYLANGSSQEYLDNYVSTVTENMTKWNNGAPDYVPSNISSSQTAYIQNILSIVQSVVVQYQTLFRSSP